MKIETYIERYDPCLSSIPFLRKFDAFEDAWKKCPRGDWMLSAAKLLEVDIRALTLAKGLCANTVRHLMEDQRSIPAVDAAIAFGRGEIDEEELRDYAHTAAAAAAAAYAAAYAAAADAADAAAAAAAAAYEAADSDPVSALRESRKQTADICREVLTGAVMEKLAKENK